MSVSVKSFFLPELQEFEQGLYQPGKLQLGWVKTAVLVSAGVAIMLLGQMYAAGAAYLVFAALMGWRYGSEQRRFGARGRPLVRIQDGVVLFSLASRLAAKQVEVPLREVKKLTLLGDLFKRAIVFERRHGDPIRFTVAYGRHDARVVEFLQRQMPERVPVEVKEPPAALGGIRSDDY